MKQSSELVADDLVEGHDYTLELRLGTAHGGENYSTLERVAEFADVARPGVGGEHAARGVAQLRGWAAVDGAQRH